MSSPSTPLPEQGGFNERLDRILDLLGERCIMQEHGLTGGSKQDEIDRSAADIRTLVLEEIIGQDVELRDPDGHQPNAYMYLKKGKNELRAEQRKKLEDTRGTK